MGKEAFLSFDVEELSDSLCFGQGSRTKDLPSAMDGMEVFFSLCEKLSVKATLFVLASRVDECLPFLKRALDEGFEIAFHGYEHVLASSYPLEEFKRKTLEGKGEIERKLGVTIRGYRAPGWAITQEEYQALPELGFSYSSSLCYGKEWACFLPPPKLEGYRKEDGFLYRGDSFCEFALPTVPKGPFRGLALGGGVVPRLFPFRDTLSYLKTRIENGDAIVLNAHPFEFSRFRLPKGLGLHFYDRLYLEKGKASWAKRLEGMILLLKKEGYVFDTFSSFLRSPRSGEIASSEEGGGKV